MCKHFKLSAYCVLTRAKAGRWQPRRRCSADTAARAADSLEATLIPLHVRHEDRIKRLDCPSRAGLRSWIRTLQSGHLPRILEAQHFQDHHPGVHNCFQYSSTWSSSASWCPSQSRAPVLAPSQSLNGLGIPNPNIALPHWYRKVMWSEGPCAYTNQSLMKNTVCIQDRQSIHFIL
jgi:hypothetical protein